MEQMNLFNTETITNYYLMNKDTKLLKFSYNKNSLTQFKIKEIYVKINKFSTSDLLTTWIMNRSIPTNREHIVEVLNSIGLNNYSAFDLLCVNHACSLNDTLWIMEVNEKNIYNEDICWNDVSLYRGFKESLGLISFFGNTSSLGGKLKTPEVTTQGVLGKAWRYVNGEIILYKKGSSGACNTGNEPYSELMASVILDFLNIPHIEYTIDKWNGVLCSTCKLYTNENIGFISMHEYLSNKIGSTLTWTYDVVLKEIKELNLESQFNDMLIFDYLILNRDRHFRNFGLLINNDTLEILGFMPLFDHGYSLGNFALSEEDIKNDLNNFGTFNTTLLVQGKSFANTRRAKEMIKLINLNMNKLDKLVIPKQRIELAKETLKLTTSLIM